MPLRALLTTALLVVTPLLAVAQPPANPVVSIPRVMTISGVFQPADGQPPRPVETIVLALYTRSDGGEPIWEEVQAISLDAEGRYTVVLGVTRRDGIPPDVVEAGAEWLGVRFDRPLEHESARTRLTSVPYALRAASADTLGGRPASDYLLAPSAAGESSRATRTGTSGDAARDTTAAEQPVTANLVLPGSTNYLAKYVNSVDLGASAIAESAGRLGLGTTAPADQLHVQFTNTNGTLTGLAVQNLGNTVASYSGMLFYDQNGALGQFQGFNNSTHEYRINNIAQASGVFNGSINFMIGSTSRLLVATNGNVGIGTSNPDGVLEASNANSSSPLTNVLATSFAGSSPSASLFVGRKARGTSSAPAAVLAGDALSGFLAAGFGNTSFSGSRGGMLVAAAEDWTDADQGTNLIFNTTALGTVAPTTKMTIDSVGNVGIGTDPAGTLHVARTGGSQFYLDAFSGSAEIAIRRANGTAAAPTPVLQTEELGIVGAGGYDGTTMVSLSAGFGIYAMEDWTSTARGSAIIFGATPIGATDPEVVLGMLPSGFVGIGTPPDVNGAPTAMDRLQVFGDIRVGTSGTDGCLRNFAGTGIAGTCSSDRRFKRDITPFASMLGKVAALQPVHYRWRAAEFPAKHFSDAPAVGLIAQDVEEVLPELVVTNDDGYKAIDYSQLPLLTIQAVKELKTENDLLKSRLAEVERLLDQLRSLVK